MSISSNITDPFTYTRSIAHYWEGGPPIEEADRLANSTPIYFNKLLAQRATTVIKAQDQYVEYMSTFIARPNCDVHRPLIDALTKTGYRVNFGEDDSGFLFLALKRAGGYYLGTHHPFCGFLEKR